MLRPGDTDHTDRHPNGSGRPYLPDLACGPGHSVAFPASGPGYPLGMTDQEEGLRPLGQPTTDPGDPADEPDIAGEHEDTAVDKRIVAGDDEGEPESPRGWAGADPG